LEYTPVYFVAMIAIPAKYAHMFVQKEIIN